MALAAQVEHVTHRQGAAVGEAQARPVFGLVAARAGKVSVLELDGAVEVFGNLGLARERVWMVRIVAGCARHTDRGAVDAAEPGVDGPEGRRVANLDRV
jgi:hypothetical protein